MKKGESEVEYFHSERNKFLCIKELEGAASTALCSNDRFMYSLDNKFPNVVKLWSPIFASCKEINLASEYVADTEIDMCFISDCELCDSFGSHNYDAQHCNANENHILVLSASCPDASVSAVSQVRGKLWQLDYRLCKDLDLRFNPCNVSVSRGRGRVHSRQRDQSG